MSDESFALMAKDVSEMRTMVAELLDAKRALVPPKEWYTTTEFAEIVGRAPYTVMELCRHGRLNAAKRLAGRGTNKDWSISHAELNRYQNEGLLPIARNTH